MKDSPPELCRICAQPFSSDELVAFFHHTGEYVHPGCVYVQSTEAQTPPWLSTWSPGALSCEECFCIGESARGWIARIVEDEGRAELGTYVVAYCPACAEDEFELTPRGDSET